MMADILFTIGMLGFMAASLRQLRKIYRTHNTDGISLTHYHWKFIAVTCMTVGYVLQALPISLVVSCLEGFITLVTIALIMKYRKSRGMDLGLG